VVGVGNFLTAPQAFRWTPEGGMIALGDLPGGLLGSTANGVSADGLTVAGTGSATRGSEAFRWTQASGMLGLGDLPGGAFSSVANGISADGSTIVGAGSSRFGFEAYLWTQVGGMVGLGDLPGGAFFSEARDVSADGSTVVGFAAAASGNEAFLWDAAHGMRSLQGVLTDTLGLDLDGWTLNEAMGISDDGLTIVGRGINPGGFPEAWIVTLPEPASLILLALGATVVTRRSLLPRPRIFAKGR